ncbi:MAG: carbohydrate porin [Calditrichota bacterium]
MTATLNSGEFCGWDNGTLFLYGLGLLGGSPSRLVGDAQGVSNIEAPDAVRLYEAWYEQLFLGARLSILAGVYSLGSEFNVIRTAALFVNSSHGTNPTLGLSGRNGPSIFPYTSPGLRIKWIPHTGLALQLAVLDGVPGKPGYPHGTHILIRPGDGALVVAEADYLLLGGATISNGPRWLRRHQASAVSQVPFRARFVLGTWRYTGKFPSLTRISMTGKPAQHKGSNGLYAQAEGQIFREPADPDQGLSAFAQIGLANQQVNRFTRYLGVGCVYRGLVSGRAADRLGFAVAAAFNGQPYEELQRRAGTALDRAEIDLEWTYLAPLSQWFALQGDIQYVIHPNTDPSLGNALMVDARILISF